MTQTGAIALLVVLALAGCGTPAAPNQAHTPVPHGFVKGATEMDEPQLRLVTLDSGGELTAFDPATEEAVILGHLENAARLTTDGRFAFSAAADGTLGIVDTGAWTVPHGDHSHYYLAKPRSVGTLDGGVGAGIAQVASSGQFTSAFFPGTGVAVILDANALGNGDIREVARIPGAPHEGVAVPLGGQVLVSRARPGDDRASSVRVHAANGEPIAAAACEGLEGWAITRVGVVFGCHAGALLATESAGRVSFETIPYPEQIASTKRATAFAARPGRPSVAAIAHGKGVWLLDSRERKFTLIPVSETLVRVTAVGDSEDRVVALDHRGRVLVISPDGVEARSEPLDGLAGGVPPEVSLEVDIARAYINVPSTGIVHEIDFKDAARVARSLDVPGDAHLFVETGR